MDIALCYENVNPARGGCEHYISDLARRLSRDGHSVHLYASRWEADALPTLMHYHRIPQPTGNRAQRPWKFAEACERALAQNHHDLSIGFDKTWGQDILYPQGGLHAASMQQNILKYPSGFGRFLARLSKRIDPAARSFARLERRQYCTPPRPRIVVNSQMVRKHFEEFYDIPAEEIQVLPSAIDPAKFLAEDRLKRRSEERGRWGITSSTPVGLFVAMNYRLKGLAPLLSSLMTIPPEKDFKIIVVGHPKTARYERMARYLGVQDRVKFLGFRADPSDAYFASDFLVHPTFYDPCSLVALEALACGLPVITTKYNGASELFRDGEEGIVVSDPHNAQELGGAIARLIDNSVRTPMSAAARQAAKRWNFEMHYQKFLGLMKQVAQLKRAA
ncbi:glycosyltransferase family 4 protein [Telmatocola sphagniphila]|uniref:Glycosyltransferase family 4 protein n=2 Tax=Telmatocola sphagniphila TaxID=1123043 RepID=A0A8E6BDB9_9BACT|nr:glycosyltransferase family 4 protein [Telmatocola sphagniphila]